MKPPPIQYGEAAQRRGSGCGCSFGCLGMGCLLLAAGFLGLLFLAYYATVHTSLPLRLIEQAIEQDGKLQIEGLNGNFANGIRFDSLRFLGDGKRWSELHDVALQYQGLTGINFSGVYDIREIRIGGGTLYVNGLRPEQIRLQLPGFNLNNALDEQQRNALQKTNKLILHTVDIGRIDVINPHSSFRFAVDHARISGLRFERGQLRDLGVWSIESDPLEVKTDSSRRWPNSPTARRLVATFRHKFFPNLRTDFGLTLEIEGGESPLQYHGECADGKLRVDDNGRRTIVEYADYTPGDFFRIGTELPLQHITFRAIRPVQQPAVAPIELESGGQFQVGETVFQMNDESLDANLNLLRGETTLAGRKVRIELDSNSGLFNVLAPRLWLDDQPATSDEWAMVVYGRPPDELNSLERSILERAVHQAADAAERGANNPSAEQPAEAPWPPLPEMDGVPPLPPELPVEQDNEKQPAATTPAATTPAATAPAGDEPDDGPAEAGESDPPDESEDEDDGLRAASSWGQVPSV